MSVLDRTGVALVVGFAVSGRAAGRVLAARGWQVRAVDDAVPGDDATKFAAGAGIELVVQPSRDALERLVASSDLVVLSPGVPPAHPVFALATPEQMVAEVELGYELASRADKQVVAITGTNGKTTVTTLVTAMLRAAGMRAEAVGNIGRPFVEAADTGDAEVFVVEVSSFQLAWTKEFHPSVACWLNFAEDHLDWHPDLDRYAEAKARIWANQGPGDVAVVNAESEVVMTWSAKAPGTVVTFGHAAGDYTESDGDLSGPDGPICAISDLPRSLPHDRSNALAAAAVARSAGASVEACHTALLEGVAMPHRIELVASADGVAWFDDSKATTPSAVVAALAGFEDVVLIAGGRNKGLDLSAIVREGNLAAVRAVVAIGEAGPDVREMFGGRVPVELATSMGDAVASARRLAAETGASAALLSPGCASFDWYRNYAERGDDFARHVLEMAGTAGSAARATQQQGGT
jgi:UDP-N-acetylmuramoylalanine--D-glutamate ligase